ncbi:NADPH:quinone reductase [Streptomyces sp. BE133]|uniref:NADPH:quinone reductase n=1 Tax=Streptomyces sp. BE133 TaxID=3002523 RepID=UPI002E770DE6|nr:NADPH:quinone reductase [Streptomyces sp. BE133]MEE1807004.1 NADPH:quinone reductase [Streptomyces sp. BE133]
MLASWYDEQGPAADVLQVGELPDPTPGPGEVRVRVTVSGVNPGETKKRRGWLGSAQGVLGAVGSLAAQLAHWDGATMIGTVRRTADLDLVDTTAVAHAVALDGTDPAAAIRSYAPDGVHRVIEVALSDNANLDCAVVRNDAITAAYATRDARPQLPFWPLLFNNVTPRMLGSDDFPAEVKRQAARDLTAAAATGALTVETGARYPLNDIAKAHDHVEAGIHGRVLVDVPRP